MQIIAKKTNYRPINAKNSVSTSELTTIYGVRTLGAERSFGQYKLVDGSKTTYFNNFQELRRYNNTVLERQNKFVILVKGEIPQNENYC